jgi:pilus assembly protein Flp/PilA
MREFVKKVKAHLNLEEGQGMVEYALILFLVSVIAIGALTAIGTNVRTVLQTVANHLNPVA